jgi:hypothetical protein
MLRIVLAGAAVLALGLPFETIPVGAADYERESKIEVERDDDETTVKNESKVDSFGRETTTESETKIERDDDELKVERKVERDHDRDVFDRRVYVAPGTVYVD